MIFASCSRCGYAMDIFQELSQLIQAPLACPRCGECGGELELKLQTADDFEAHAVEDCGTQALTIAGRRSPSLEGPPAVRDVACCRPCFAILSADPHQTLMPFSARGGSLCLTLHGRSAPLSAPTRFL
jgi:hypothetical protein